MIRNYRRPFPAALVYPGALCRARGRGRVIYLTFDDGPDPLSTPSLLEVLHQHDVKGTFFCTGSRVQAAPGLFAGIAAGGHVTGNHGYSHLNGLTTSVRSYCADVFRGRDITCSNLFRPPYGRIRMRQYRILERSMQIIFWDVMPYDFDPSLTADASLAVLMKRVRPGSVVVLHDTPASHALQYLGRFIGAMHAEGYRFETIDDYLSDGV